jgi:adenosylcobinamide amidohydrolase
MKAGERDGIKWQVLSHNVWGAPANALIITLNEPRRLLSSRDGLMEARAVCNCYLPKPVWSRFDEHPESWPNYLRQVLAEAGLEPDETAALSTGMSMDCMAVAEEEYAELRVTAFVTAGVLSNALRIGMDRGDFLEKRNTFEKIGTINTIVIPNARLETPALAASFISITEAKNIALQEADVRSVYTPEWQATGTGTDQIVMVSGDGETRRYVGGHTKLGEMTARAVTRATLASIKKGLEANSAGAGE